MMWPSRSFLRLVLNEPVCSQLPGGEIHWSFAQYIDYALLLSDSSFTIAEEEPQDTALLLF